MSRRYMIMAIVSCLALLSCEKPHEDDLVQDVITDEKPAEKPEDKPETPDTSQVDQVQPDYAFVQEADSVMFTSRE